MRKTNEAGIRLIMDFEKLEIRAYKDVGGVLTVGVGHTGPDVVEGMTVSPKEAMELLAADLERFEECVNRHVTRDLNENEFSALVSFSFNVGRAAFAASSMLSLVNQGLDPSAAWMKWVYVKRKRVAGLYRRRKAELALFLTPVAVEAS